MDDDFSPKIKEVVAASKEIALTYKNEQIDTSHLLLALFKQEKSEIYKSILREQQVSVMKDLINLKSITTKTKTPTQDSFHLTRRSERVLKTTFLEAKLFQDHQINLFHLLLCILRNENDPVTKVLNRHNIDYDSAKDIYKVSKKYKSSPKSPSRNPSQLSPFESTQYVSNTNLYFRISYSEGDRYLELKNIKGGSDRLNYIKNINKNAYIFGVEINDSNDDELLELSKLQHLKEISISNSDLSNSKALKKFIHIQRLFLKQCRLDNLLQIVNLKKLKLLDLSKNYLTDILLLEKLPLLDTVDVSFNIIENVEPLIKVLKNNGFILFGKNKITSLSKEFLFTFFENDFKISNDQIRLLKNYFVRLQKYESAAMLRDIEKTYEKDLSLSIEYKEKFKEKFIEDSFTGLQLTSPPKAIIEGGIEDIDNYFSTTNKSTKKEFLYEGKLLVIGEGGTGKTSFARKMEDINSKLPKDNETTFNIEVRQIKFDKNEAADEIDKTYINIWDFGGQKIYRGTHQLFFSDKCLYVLIDDNREEKTDFSYWLNTIQQLAGKDASLIIVLNEKHGRKGFSFDKQGFKSQFGDVIKDVIEINLLEDKSSIKILRDLIHLRFRQLPLFGSELPVSWVEIRKELSDITENYITFDFFKKVCQNHSISDNNTIKTISSYFNNIGVFTHYNDDPILRERIYLNSNWLVETIYEVLDNTIIDTRAGRILESDVKEIWGDKELDFEIDRLCNLMNRFGLMYQIEGTNQFVIPEKLPKKMPYTVWKYENEINIKFKYEFDKYYPKGIMSRLIVKLHKYIIDQNLVWHRGVNIEFESTYAEIIETYSSNNSFVIKVSGANMKGLLAIVIDKFDELLSIFKNLKFEKMVQCNCLYCLNNEDSHFFKYSDLLKRKEKGVEKIECEKDYEKIDVGELLNGLNSGYIQKSKRQKEFRIFLASSKELTEDREKFELFINRENKKLISKGVFLNLIIWEDFKESVSGTRLQDEYNKELVNSDIFISLVSTKVGKFTMEEFDVAYKSFMKKNKPKYLFTYLKKQNVDITKIGKDDFESIQKFKNRLNKIEHFPSYYDDYNDLNRQLKLQIDKILIEEKLI